MYKHTTIGLDIAKNVFHLVRTDGRRRKLRRSQVLSYFTQMPESTVVMEACGSAHYWGREFTAMGHKVVLLPPQHVKAYLRGQKNDYNDAQAILEAALHGRIRSVSVKSKDQQANQALLIMRKGLVRERTRLVNQTRALIYEYGIVIPKSLGQFRACIIDLLDKSDAEQPVAVMHIMRRQYERVKQLDEELEWYESQIKQSSKLSDDCRRLSALPGFGPIVSFAFKSWLGTGHQFKRGREAASALGLVPRQHTSGDKARLLGITKKGDAYLRSLVVHGARSVVRQASKKNDSLSQWINRLVLTRGINKATVALANKLVRIAWVVIAKQEVYQPSPVAEH